MCRITSLNVEQHSDLFERFFGSEYTLADCERLLSVADDANFRLVETTPGRLIVVDRDDNPVNDDVVDALVSASVL